MADEDILFGCEGGVAAVTLNRPQALNAFTLDMYRRFDPMLRAWAEDSSVKAVLIRGAGERAFCAGGAGPAVHEGGRCPSGHPPPAGAFFPEGYEHIRRHPRRPEPPSHIFD